MALKRKNRIDSSFSLASMSDLVFLLLIFFMITSTMIAPNALKLLLPKSNNQTAAKPVTAISITKDIQYYINDNGKQVPVGFSGIEPFLKSRFPSRGNEDVYISLHADKSVPWEEVVKIMNIANRNKFKLIAATAPED